MNVAAAVLVAAGLLASLYRWNWVSQREHYISPSAILSARRWVTVDPSEAALLSVAAAGAITALVLGTVGSTLADPLGAVSAVLGALFPWRMPIGAIRLRLTRRAALQAGASAVLGAVVAVVIALVTGRPGAGAIVVAAGPALVDLPAAALAPLERRLAGRFVDRARRKLAQISPRIVAITGSYGKTSTKNHVADLLAGTYQTVASPASWNNMAGLSRAVNERLLPGTEVFVAEMGTYGPGEIRAMCEWARPEVAVICEIGPMHLERMRTIENIVKAKSEITERADHVILWVDNPWLDGLAGRLDSAQHKIWRVGRVGRVDLDVSVVEEGADLSFFWGEEAIGTVDLGGRVQPGNVACAVAVALALGVQPTRIAAQLGSLSAPPHRAVAERGQQGFWVIDDTYNANPAGARASVARLASLAPEGRRVVVTPGMVELGPKQEEENEGLAAAVSDSGAELVIVGRTNSRALRRGYGGPALSFSRREQARKWVSTNLGPGDAVLWENDLPPHYP